MAPPLQLTVGNGWAVDFEAPSGVNLARRDTPRSNLTLSVLAQVFATPCSATPTLLGPLPSDVLMWLRANTGLTIASERPTMVNGREATVVNVTAGTPCAGHGAVDLPFLALNGELFALDPGDVAEITVIDFGGYTVTAIAAGPASTIASFLDRTRIITTSLADR